MINLVVNGVSYSYPQTGDQNWGDGATNWASAVTSGMLQKAGGSFPLTADANFGTNFGLIAKYFTSVSSNAAGSGAVRLANGDGIGFRNVGNTADILLQPDADGILQYGGIDLVNLSATQTLSNKTFSATNFTGTVTSTYNGVGFQSIPATNTSYGAVLFTNSGGNAYIGAEGSTAAINTGGTAYALALTPGSGQVTEFGYSGGTGVGVRIDTSGNLKPLKNLVVTGTASASNLSGTNTGDITLGSANGLSLSGQALSLALASTSTTGALSSTDWNTFNNKQATITEGNLTEATSSVLTITGGTSAVIGSGTSIQVKQASGSQAGYLASADWTTFNNKAPTASPTFTGTVTAAAATFSGLITSTVNGLGMTLTPTTGTSGGYIQVNNTGGIATIGQEGSSAAINTGGTAYALGIAPASGRVVEIGYNGGAAVAVRLDTSGNLNVLKSIAAPNQTYSGSSTTVPAAGASYLRLTSASLTAFSAISGGIDGQILYLQNLTGGNISVTAGTGTNAIVNLNNTPANANFTFYNNQMITLIFDGSNSRWVVTPFHA